jgi:hypothetical protein
MKQKTQITPIHALFYNLCRRTILLVYQHYIYVNNFNQNLQNSALLISRNMHVHYFIAPCFKDTLVSAPWRWRDNSDETNTSYLNDSTHRLYRVIKNSQCIRTIPIQLTFWRWPSQNTFGMWTMLYLTRPSRTQFGVSINVWRLAGDTLNITLTFCTVIFRCTVTFWSPCRIVHLSLLHKLCVLHNNAWNKQCKTDMVPFEFVT